MTIDTWQRILSQHNAVGAANDIPEDLSAVIETLAHALETNSALAVMAVTSTKSEGEWVAFSKGIWIGALLAIHFAEVDVLERMACK